MTAVQGERPPKELWIEAMRLLLLVQVILGHAVALCGPNFSQALATSQSQYAVARVLFGFGREAAALFIFISGALTAGLLFRPSVTATSPAIFLYQRLRRMMPTAIIAVLVTALLDYIGGTLLAYDIYTNNLMGYNAKAFFTLNNFVGNILALQPTLSGTFGSNGPLWTVGYLIQFYVVALLLNAYFNNPKTRLAALMVAVLTLAVINQEAAAFFALWTSAGLIPAARQKWASKLAPSFFTKPLTLSLVAVALFSFGRTQNQFFSILLVGACGFLLFIALNPPHRQERQASYNAVEKIILSGGNLSYATYAIHTPILFLVVGGMQVYIGQASKQQLGFGSFVTAATLTMVCSFGIALLIEAALKKPAKGS